MDNEQRTTKTTTIIANPTLYAHYVFNTLDQDHSGIVSFEVSAHILSYLPVLYSLKDQKRKR